MIMPALRIVCWPSILHLRKTAATLEEVIPAKYISKICSIRNNRQIHCLQKGPYFKDLVWSFIRTILAFWVLIYISGSLFSLFWFQSRKECQFSLIFAGIGSGLHCYHFFIFTYAYALIFIHHRFGSLFWLLGVLFGSLFHQKWVLIPKHWGPY